MERALTMLNEAGDTTISWTPDRDAEMEEIIRKKMADGVTFFVIEPRKGRPPAVPKRGEKLRDAGDAMKQRALVIPDEDLSRFVATGAGTAAPTPDEPVRGARVSRDAREVSKSQSVGARQRRGG